MIRILGMTTLKRTMMIITIARTAPTIVQDKVRLSEIAMIEPPVPNIAA